MPRKFESDYRIKKLDEILPSENAFRQDVDLRLAALEGQYGVIDRAAAEARDRVIAYAEQEISPKAAELMFILSEYATTIEGVRDAANATIATLRDGVDARGDTLAKILAITDLLAPSDHAHQIADVVGLEAELQSKVSQTGIAGAALLPVGTTAQRPAGATGHIRYNSTLSAYEGYNGATWTNISGAGVYLPLAGGAMTGAITLPSNPSSAMEAATKQYADSVAAAVAVPSGAIMFFARNTPPTGWLKANGALVSRTTYADLFEAIGMTFGAGDGSTTFGLPDLRGEFPRGWDDSRGVDSGRAFGSTQIDAFQSHFHDLNPSTLVWRNGGGSVLGGSGFSNAYNLVVGWPTTDGYNGAPRLAAETRPRNLALLACIKY